MWTAETSPTITLPPEDAHGGLAPASLLSAFIALIVIRVRRRCTVRKRRAQAVPLSRKTSAEARKTTLSRYSVALLLLASPGARAELEAGWDRCCMESSIRGGDMVHGAMNGGAAGSFSEDLAKELCESTPNCSFVSYWGTSSTDFVPTKKLYTRHASADVGIKRVTSGNNPATALVFSRCRPELQPMRACGGARLTDSSGCTLRTGMARPHARRAPMARATSLTEASRLRLSPTGQKMLTVWMQIGCGRCARVTASGACRISLTSAALA